MYSKQIQQQQLKTDHDYSLAASLSKLHCLSHSRFLVSIVAARTTSASTIVLLLCQQPSSSSPFKLCNLCFHHLSHSHFLASIAAARTILHIWAEKCSVVVEMVKQSRRHERKEGEGLRRSDDLPTAQPSITEGSSSEVRIDGGIAVDTSSRLLAPQRGS
ncbi:hypothetical protein PIB30_038047 [Stylosanthes scabra]|uniref:Uncharacterized protein n=1 Tax=Stylosanthes scabra TaxID=79078 RepID=A0ABU6VCU8_9FABA|nr:hypothetical protein [Stylosanthes scabra]